MREPFEKKVPQLKTNGFNNNPMKQEKLLLVLLPFWTPLIPPQGIASLKSFLQKEGYKVKTIDANVEDEFKEIHEMYFETLKEYIPGNRQGNLYRVGHELLRNHMMAHLNVADEDQYFRLVKLLVHQTYFTPLTDQQVSKLNSLMDKFYTRLENRCIEWLEREKPDVLGISVTVGTLPASMFVFKLTRERYPHIMTVMGGCVFLWGVHQSPDFDLFLKKVPYIDKIIIGEGEHLFHQLLQGKLPHAQKVYSLKDIAGETLNILSILLPDISDFDIHQYPYLSAFGSIGCPFKCGFCCLSTFYGRYRRKEVKKIVDEMVTLYKKFKLQVFLMNDSLINPLISDLAHEFIKSDITLYWDALVRVDESVGNPENTLLWRRGGLYRARLGVESGSQRVLDLMNKKITLEQSRAAISSLAYAGIKTSAFIVVGYPGETEEDFQQTLDFIEELKNELWQVDCTPFMCYYTGQGKSDQWASLRKLLYPPEFRDMLITQTWILDTEPSREETYQRMNRLVEHCKKLGIPNPFSLNEYYQADERWKRLHENAVPPLIQFKNSEYINETNKVKKLVFATNTWQENGDFLF
ncbi:MAG: radical SAM protein [Candidatus Aminicenantes bacterium]|jgi:radical SAM superfamily enzyme YgiQ (UPF0313 family)